MNLIKKIGQEELEAILRQDDVLAKIAEALKTLSGLDPKTEANIAVYDQGWKTTCGPIIYACDGFIKALTAELTAPDDANKTYLAARTEEYMSGETPEGVAIVEFNLRSSPNRSYFPPHFSVDVEKGSIANTLEISVQEETGKNIWEAQQLDASKLPYDRWENLLVGKHVIEKLKATRQAQLGYDLKSRKWSDLSGLKGFEVHIIGEPDLA